MVMLTLESSAREGMPLLTLVMRGEPDLLRAARRGDERTFSELVAPHRAALQLHCYRMLGSLHDAEDALQETLLNAWRALPRFEGRSSLSSWLYTIATNTCLKMLQRRPRPALPLDEDPADSSPPPVGSASFGPDAVELVDDALDTPAARYERRESVELAFIAARRHIPARQRAVLILRDVLAFSAREVAEALEMTPAAVDTALQRAHRTVDDRLTPRSSQQHTLRAVGDERSSEVVDDLVDAWERADVHSVVAMLAREAKGTGAVANTAAVRMSQELMAAA